MARIIRIRCPICGFLGNQNRLDGHHEFEIVIQHTTSRGRGRITHEYYQPEHAEGLWLLKLGLIEKLRVVADGLEAEVRSERESVYRETLQDEGFAEAWKVHEVSSKEARLSIASVSGLTGRHVVISIPGEAPVQMLLPTRTWEVPSAEEDVTTDERIFADAEETMELPASPGLFLFGKLRSQTPSAESVETDSEEGGEKDEAWTFRTGTKQSS